MVQTYINLPAYNFLCTCFAYYKNNKEFLQPQKNVFFECNSFIAIIIPRPLRIELQNGYKTNFKLVLTPFTAKRNY